MSGEVCVVRLLGSEEEVALREEQQIGDYRRVHMNIVELLLYFA